MMKNKNKKNPKEDDNLFNQRIEAKEEEKENEESEEEEGEEENQEEDVEKETKNFLIELVIHTRVMDNREEIKKCICHNYLTLNEDKLSEENESEDIFLEKEIIPSLKIPINTPPPSQNSQNENDKFCIKISDLTKSLAKIGFPVSGSMINIFINYANNYVYFGTEPVDEKIFLHSYMLEPNKDIIKIKIINYIQKRMLDGYSNSIINTYFRKPIYKQEKNKNTSLELKKFYTPSMTNLDYYVGGKDDDSDSSIISESFDNKEYGLNDQENQNNIKNKKGLKYGNMSDSDKRERKIGYIIEKVYAWRKLYNGYKDEKNNYIKYDLEKSSQKINVSKKSLDDYLLQIRLGRKYQFDFDSNKYKKIGILRDYVKEKKDKEGNNGNKGKNLDMVTGEVTNDGKKRRRKRKAKDDKGEMETLNNNDIKIKNTENKSSKKLIGNKRK